jgi:hypothetical protein
MTYARLSKSAPNPAIETPILCANCPTAIAARAWGRAVSAGAKYLLEEDWYAYLLEGFARDSKGIYRLSNRANKSIARGKSPRVKRQERIVFGSNLDSNDTNPHTVLLSVHLPDDQDSRWPVRVVPRQLPIDVECPRCHAVNTLDPFRLKVLALPFGR